VHVTLATAYSFTVRSPLSAKLIVVAAGSAFAECTIEPIAHVGITEMTK